MTKEDREFSEAFQADMTTLRTTELRGSRIGVLERLETRWILYRIKREVKKAGKRIRRTEKVWDSLFKKLQK